MNETALNLVRQCKQKPTAYLPAGMDDGAYHRIMGRIFHGSDAISQTEWSALAKMGLPIGNCDFIPVVFQARDETPGAETFFCGGLVTRLIDERLLREFWGFQAELDGGVSVLLCFQFKLDDAAERRSIEQIQNQCEAIVSACQVQYDLKLSAHIGKYITSAELIAEEYEHVWKAVQFSRFFDVYQGVFRLVVPDQPDKHVFSILQFVDTATKDIIAQLQRRDHTLRALGLQHLEVLRSMRPYDADVLRDNYKYLVEHTYSELVALRMITPSQLSLETVAWRYLVGCKKWHEIVERYMAFLDGIAKLYSDNTNNEKRMNVTEAMQYLYENFRRPELTVQEIAEHVHAKPSTLCSAFKRYYGVPILEKLHELRVELACNLLEHTNLNLSEISAQCGFGSRETMHRVFQRRLCTTPGSYRAARGCGNDS